ncbi:demethylmenaquinone methyltransferase [Salsuginibacillus kocurii]|uniref:demethylmenaquinone methyltransferase n=1 Tax=Salsuginibacillus kocurii TaxID=427078 RepID=UPI00037221B9|nr:demethylmenaquinone methyltransferase [Salsuginibacillus kocurii]
MLTKKEERVHRVFESISTRYDSMNSIISFNRHKAWRKHTTKHMNFKQGQAALDVCCGTGDWTLALANMAGPTGRVTGLDFSENMLEVGREKIKAAEMENVEMIAGNAMELPFENDSFEAVTIGFGLRNVPDRKQVLKEMYRVLKPGGELVCLETSHPEGRLFKPLYYFYFKRIMPIFGKIFAKSYEEYSWLQESTMTFPTKAELAAELKSAGYEEIRWFSYSQGVAATHIGYKPIEE